MDREEELDRMVSDSLAGGRIRLSTLLVSMVKLDQLRSLAKSNGISPKGYRVEKASADMLSDLLAESEDPEVLREACALVLAESSTSKRTAAPEPRTEVDVRRHREREVKDLRAELQRYREQLARAREREADWNRRLSLEEEKVAKLRSQIAGLSQEQRSEREVSIAPDQSRRIRDLELDLEALGEAEAALRRLLALRAARIRELEGSIAELEPLVPKGRRRKAKPAAPAPVLSEHFRLPRFPASFYKSLEGKDRRSLEKAMHAVLIFCVEGPTYPGLEVKQLEGMDIWSLRASLKLRVFFQLRGDGDVDFLALADREDQHTTLRRLKDR
ncbi:MAG: hypothetical protein ACYTG5_18400 [Planctomycetota bacterium]|jgi:hypothetical protein